MVPPERTSSFNVQPRTKHAQRERGEIAGWCSMSTSAADLQMTSLFGLQRPGQRRSSFPLCRRPYRWSRPARTPPVFVFAFSGGCGLCVLGLCVSYNALSISLSTWEHEGCQHSCSLFMERLAACVRQEVQATVRRMDSRPCGRGRNANAYTPSLNVALTERQPLT